MRRLLGSAHSWAEQSRGLSWALLPQGGTSRARPGVTALQNCNLGVRWGQWEGQQSGRWVGSLWEGRGSAPLRRLDHDKDFMPEKT